MCFQLVEIYSACRCIYYQHAVDRCSRYGQPGHGVEQRTIYVGYACTRHSSRGNWNDKRDPNHGDVQVGGDDDDDDDDDDGDGDTSSLVDGASIFSSDTHASTSMTDLENAEARSLVEPLFRDMLYDPVLHHLWPQILRLSKSRTRAKVSIERLLRRYASDLGKSAKTDLENDASKLVRWARRDIAQRLTEAHLLENPHEESAEHVYATESRHGLEPEEEAELGGVEMERLHLRVKYESARSFLFESETFEAFKANVKTFVRFKKPSFTRESYYDVVLAYLERQRQWIVESYFEPPIRPSVTRVRWTCHCGHKSFDDVMIPDGKSAIELDKFLADYTSLGAKLLGGARIETTDDNAPPNGPAENTNAATGLYQGVKRLIANMKGKPVLPLYSPGAGNNKRSGGSCDRARALATDSSGATHHFLALCIPFMRHGVKAYQPDVCGVLSDYEFFSRVTSTYSSTRKRERWSFMRKVKKIEFVKFRLFKEDLIDVVESPSIPTHPDRKSYSFEERDSCPILGSSILMHLFENPDHADVLPVIFKMVPKKLDEQITRNRARGTSVGWGLWLIEGVNYTAVFLCGCAGFVICTVVAGIWSAVMEDVQGGFGIVAFLLTFSVFCVGSLYTLVT